jgi:RNA polymerase sigma-70 factor (ECF subfamily)
MAIVAVSTVTGPKTGNEFEALFQEHYSMVYRTAYSILNNEADAEDVLQTVFLRLIRREFPPEFRSNAKGYFYRASVNLSLDTIRKRKRFELTDDAERFEAAGPSPSDTDHAEQIHKRLADAIAGLNPEAAHILILRYAHNYSDAEIAKLLGTSRSAIAVRLFRSRARLKKLMRESAGDEK